MNNFLIHFYLNAIACQIDINFSCKFFLCSDNLRNLFVFVAGSNYRARLIYIQKSTGSFKLNKYTPMYAPRTLITMFICMRIIDIQYIIMILHTQYAEYDH